MAPAAAAIAMSHAKLCNHRPFGVAIAAAQPLIPALPASKSVALLGGQPSALDLIRAAQAAPSAPAPAAANPQGALPAELKPLEPAAGGNRLGPLCSMTSASAVRGAARPQPSYSSQDFLASKRLAIGRTSFDAAWSRVRNERVPASYVRALEQKAAGGRRETLGVVNAFVNRKIAFTDDRDLFGRADYWAGARKTLALGRGDCEDIALTKMQLLAAMGVAREDMVLTIARDLVRNADHAVLIVRDGGRYLMLDNATDAILDASASHDYRAILSFGQNKAWLHGYQIASR
ncbi:Predicted transglutaminase-like cysteine proteinase [Sphingopyxis flava]|uniref:Predicted transglutaminase-like cysteine proteinase n=2 Tax=Sphingopyxis flava TaxID=1507287 RepID=A0A1T5FJ29_9SPHN|nr:Predicted transglutaminase-like cysteine proteinase [Sphingopyxis flava]